MTDKPRIEEAGRLSPNAMENDHGDVFFPDNSDDALWFAREHNARPVSPDHFPFMEAAITICYLWEALKEARVDHPTSYQVEMTHD